MKRIELYDTYEEAEAAFKKFCDDYDYDCDGCPYWNKIGSCELLWAIEDIDDSNRINKKNKAGNWIKVHPVQENDVGGYKCSICSAGFYGADRFNYCPECGTKMNEVKE